MSAPNPNSLPHPTAHLIQHPQELAVWRKQATITVQEEFVGKALPPTLEESLPPTLEDLLQTVRAGVRRSTEIYINLCILLERLIKRKEGLASDYSRLTSTFHLLTEASTDTYKIDTNDVPMLNEGIDASAKHISAHQGLLLDEARAWDDGVLEDLKRQRDGLVSMRDMFDRRDRFAKDNIPQLERRIAGNESKLSGVRANPEGLRKPGDAEKIEEAILKVPYHLPPLPSQSSLPPSTSQPRSNGPLTRTATQSNNNTPAASS